ncbi:retrovirus-related pol polyprotein from transposon TNT 1-94 [Tanacetum coccineum]|uniref:Retrovirus-related pol polyprotein from transposon TNT 1-94 n=1 Tax=Tanacetum coccineum TaxID=301880 RepID=A0ABQ5FEX5_9ASTR
MLPDSRSYSIFQTLKERLCKSFKRTSCKEVKVMEEIFDQMNDKVDQNTIKNLEHQIQEKENVIRVNDRSCEPYNANDVTDLLEQNERFRAEIEKIEDLKAQLEGNLKVATRSSVKTKILAPGMYAIDVKPIPHPLKNNRSAHLTYINHLKESVETVREIELLEYVIGTCPKSFNERDNKAPSTPVTRKKKVTFNDKPGNSSSNIQKHEVHQKVQQTNVPVIHSTGVNTSTEASGSKPRSNTKKNRIMPAKTKVNRVDSSISSKRVVINSNSESVCKTCNKCLISASHKMCVVNILNSVNATPTVKIVLNKGKQIWKPKGKLSDNSLNKTKQVVQVILWYLDSGCSKHMTGNRSKLKNFVEKFIGPVRFRNVSLRAIIVMEINVFVTVELPQKKPDLTFLRVFGALCYPTNDSKDLGKFQAKTDIGIFVGYAPSRKGYRIYNKRTRRLMETIHVTFDEMHQTMAPVRISSGPEPIMMTPGQLNSGLAPSHVPETTYIRPTDKDLEILFQPMFDEYFDQSTNSEPVPTATVVNAPIVSINTSVSSQRFQMHLLQFMSLSILPKCIL